MSDLKTIAFYLPQYHPTPFNDQQWGKGFTEWNNVAQSTPRYSGHRQPRVPGELGFYDLRRPEVMTEQITLAQAYGVYGFCFYYYRFGAVRQLSLPVDNLLVRPHLQVPFCLCWANEDWTRAWDGRSEATLLTQSYGDETLAGSVEDFVASMNDPRYIRIGGRPLILIYQLEHALAARPDWMHRLAESLSARLGVRPLIGGVHSHGLTKALAKTVDLIIQFPPHRIPRVNKRVLLPAEKVGPFEPQRQDYFESYDDVVAGGLASATYFPNMVPGVCPDWDNSPRRTKNAHIVVGSTPQKFQAWVESAARIARARSDHGNLPAPLVFVNAWNEWAEGAALEPSWADGRAYLEALSSGLASAAQPVTLSPSQPPVAKRTSGAGCRSRRQPGQVLPSRVRRC